MPRLPRRSRWPVRQGPARARRRPAGGRVAPRPPRRGSSLLANKTAHPSPMLDPFHPQGVCAPAPSRTRLDPSPCPWFIRLMTQPSRPDSPSAEHLLTGGAHQQSAHTMRSRITNTLAACWVLALSPTTIRADLLKIVTSTNPIWRAIGPVGNLEGTPIAGDGSRKCVTDPILEGEPQRFYRTATFP